MTWTPKTWISEASPLGPPGDPESNTPLTGDALTAEFDSAKGYVDDQPTVAHTYTAHQTYDAPLTIGSTALRSQDTQFQLNLTMTDPDVTSRPVGSGLYYSVQPAAAPSSTTDFHGLDLTMTVPESVNVNGNIRVYGIEGAVNHAGSQAVNQLVGVYGFPEVTGGGSITGGGALSFRANCNATGGATINNYYGLWVDAPVTDATSTITTWYGVRVPNPFLGPQVGLLSGSLSTGGPITSIPLHAALLNPVTAGKVTVTSGYQSQTFTTAGAISGATSIPVTSATPIFAFPDNSSVAQQPGTITSAIGIYSQAPVWINNDVASTQPALTVAQWSSGVGVGITVNSTAQSSSSYGLQVTQSAGVPAQAVVITQNTAAQALRVIQAAAGAAIESNQQSSGDGVYVNGTNTGNTGIGLHVNQGVNGAAAVSIAQAAAAPGISLAQNGNGNGIVIASGSSGTPITGQPLLITHYPNDVGSYGVKLVVNLGSGGTAAQGLVVQQNTNANGISIVQVGEAPSFVATKSSTGSTVASKIVNQGTGDTMQWQIGATPTTALKLTGLGSLVVGQGAALANSATDGFLYLPTVAGTPTGVPTAQTGSSAVVYDTTAHKLWAYDGAWKSVALT